MYQKKSKKIFIYIILFLSIGTLNHKDLNDIYSKKSIKINVSGLDDKNNFAIKNNLDFLNLSSLFFLKKHEINEIVSTNNLVERYSISKVYPATLNIEIDQTKFLAQTQINNKNFLLGSNGRLIKINNLKKDLPFIYGNFNNQNFFQLKTAIDQTEFEYTDIKNLFFYKSGRWDIETNDGLIIKLPQNEIKSSLEIFLNFFTRKESKDIYKIDLRQKNQIIINE
tara:strand:+ start:508 stop:1179 length:672 start_codon:yes stop_codon:yes gene_type:complete